MSDLILIGEYHVDIALLLDSIKDAEEEAETWKETLKFNEGCWREERETMIRKLYEAREENESLHKQLEARHPFKPAMDEITIGYTGCLICGKYTDHGGLQCPKMRAYAISSPENH